MESRPNCNLLAGHRRYLTKLLLVMRLTGIIILAACLHASAGGYAQTISLSEKNASLEKIFKEIKKQAGYDFFYESKLLKDSKPIDIDVTNASIEEVLNICFREQPLSFTIVEKTILVKKKVPAITNISTDIVRSPIQLRGRVVDDKSGEPVSEASVTVKGEQVGVPTNREGEFSFSYNGGDNIVLVISHVGYAEKEVKVKDDNYITIRLVVSEQSLANVEISTGMYKRRKESFTGASASFTGDQLRAVGNKNIIQSLKTLDPSFIIVENNIAGSNPNKLPSIELRGKTSITTTELASQFGSDPNLPLFVLNGFPTTLQIINNIDMNRVASITILKDAASTAIWGSKAANGVVVVETKRPVAGELRINYTADLIVDAPDLSSYNMMNAAEKLEFERLAGVYDENLGYFTYQYEADLMYNKRLADVQRGVNTYWLAEPVQTGFTHGHSLQFTGGNNDLLFGAGLSYRKEQGVMKGSDRNTWGGNVDITYRKGRINITNQLYISGYNSNESPYGSFANFVKPNPYYLKRNADGTIPKFLDTAPYGATNASLFTMNVPNPLYNAGTFSINRTNNLDINNILQGIFTIRNDLWLQGGLQLTNGTTSTVVFVAPENTAFDGVMPSQKGSYTRAEVKAHRYTGNLTLSYAKVLAGVHTFNANLRSEIAEQTSRLIGFKAIGFPEGTNGNPRFANQYDPYSVPPSASSIVRTISAMGSMNYAYKMRYLLDAVYTINGSNAFGSDHKISPSWSVGIGWNLHKESFLSQISWLDLLKLRANIGVSGNELLGTFSSNSIYTALAGSSNFGQSLDMIALGNRDLKWQNTRTISTGLEIALLNNRLSAVVNYYEKKTDPLIVNASGVYPSSVGLVFPYPLNVGAMTYTGWELNLRVSPVYRIKQRIVWTIGITGSKNNGKYSRLGNSLDAINKEQTRTNGLLRFEDGYSPDDIWLVESKGIDPASGREVYLKRDGSQTFSYSPDDIVRIANSRPKVEGIISSNFNYKGLYVNLGLRYWVGGHTLNTALYQKVENIGVVDMLDNHDKRALNDRWKQPGDIAQFKGIRAGAAPISSRFVQKDSHLVGESISIGWDFLADSWIRKLNMQGLRIYLYTNDLFRLSTIKSERGIDYPFNNSYSFGLSASF